MDLMTLIAFTIAYIVAVLVPGSDGWKMDRFFGFSDSTAKR